MAQSQAETAVIVEDDRRHREALHGLLSSRARFGAVLCFGAAKEALQHPETTTAALALIDLGLPDMDGHELISRLRAANPRQKIIAYTVFEETEQILGAIRSGANGYLLKSIAPDLLLAEIEVVLLGGAAMSPEIAERILRGREADTASVEVRKTEVKLGAREREVLTLLSLGLKYPEIASRLGISPHTVRRQIERIYEKLGAHSRAEAVQQGWALGLLRPPR